MTGPQLLIAAIVIVLVIAFIITVVLQNVTAKEIISTNTKLVENQNGYFNDEKEEDGVHIQSSTTAKSDGKIQVSSDI